MEMVATVALKPGMEVAENVTDHRGNIILKKGTKLDRMYIEKLSVNNIICINIMQPDDYVDNYFEKVKLSQQFKEFEKTYFENFTAYKVSVEFLVYNKVPINNDDLLLIVDTIRKSSTRNNSSLNNTTILDMLSVLRTDDKDFLFAHGLNVALICDYTASWFNLTDEEHDILVLSGFYYDIGKFSIPESITKKQGKLTDAEFTKMKTHPLLGYSMIQNIPAIDDNIKLATLMHHERCDGTGYPQRITEEKINKFAKIISIIDAYEAMTSYRSYRLPLCPFKVIDILAKDGYGKFDTFFYLEFIKHIVEGYIGKEVVLNNGTSCKVVLINQQDYARPMVLTENGDYIDLSKEKSLFIDRLT